MFWWTVNSLLRLHVFGGMLILAASLSACESERVPATFYPVDSLITAQIRHLAKVDAGLRKEAILKGSADTVVYTPGDTATWAKELDIFRQLDVINKPVNRDGYRVVDGLTDSGSNLIIKEFRRKRERLPVVYLRIYYQSATGRPRKIEALYEDVNSMFRSRRHLTMRFDQVGDQTVLTAYTVKGGQKMVLSDSTAYHISGRILVN